jgi:hypothetical protein
MVRHCGKHRSWIAAALTPTSGGEQSHGWAYKEFWNRLASFADPPAASENRRASDP